MTAPMAAAASSAASPTLKDGYRWQLFLILAANVLAFSAVVSFDNLRLADLEAVAADGKKLWLNLGSLAAAAIIVTVVNGLLSSTAKARLVFWRWRDPMPGCRAFTHHLRDDPRVDFPALERAVGPLPAEAAAQNALWYQLYQSVEADPVVRSTHRDFLLCRDYAALGLLALFAFGVAVSLAIPLDAVRGSYLAALVLQFLAAVWSARNYGSRLVTSAIAVWQTRQRGRVET